MEQELKKYCAFIDVLGYGSIVCNKEKTVTQIINQLESLFTNIATSISDALKDNNTLGLNTITMRSFSDSCYFHCDKPEPLIFLLSRIFNGTFNMYSDFSNIEETTPLLRAGIVKDWIADFNDIGSIINGYVLKNPVGLGVARAYYTSEKSELSGMRIIIDKEVFNDLSVCEINQPLNCFRFNINGFPFYVKHIDKNRKNENCDLYELIWAYEGMNSCTYEYVDILEKLVASNKKSDTWGDVKRHYQDTAKVILDGLLLTDCNQQAGCQYTNAKIKLEQLSTQTSKKK